MTFDAEGTKNKTPVLGNLRTLHIGHTVIDETARADVVSTLLDVLERRQRHGIAIETLCVSCSQSGDLHSYRSALRDKVPKFGYRLHQGARDFEYDLPLGDDVDDPSS